MAYMIRFVILCVLAMWAAADTPNCDNEIQKLQPCLSYVEGQSNIPTTDCCKGLEYVHVNRPVCLCILMSSSGTNVNSSTASMLPNICKVNTDPSRCPALLKGDNATAPSSAGHKSADDTAKSSSIVLLPSLALLFGHVAALFL